MTFNVMTAIGWTWAALGFLWLIGLLFTKPVVRVQSNGSRLFHVLLAFLGFMMLGTHWFQKGWLGASFIPQTGAAHHAIQLASLAIVIAGCLFAAWARIALRGNWSGAVTVKASHELIVEGPYALARHPIYTGLLLAAVGSALAVGEWCAIIGIIAILLALAVKIGQEEKLMTQTFPDAYPLYRTRVRALIPGVF